MLIRYNLSFDSRKFYKELSPIKQEMATPLGTTFSTNEQVVAQGDVTCMAKTVESLVVEFD